MPHHVTQQGNRRQQTFFCLEDYQAYCDLMKQFCNRYGVRIPVPQGFIGVQSLRL